MFPTEKLTGKQIVAARGLLDLKQADLAEAADVAKLTIIKLENGQVRPHLRTMEKIRAVLESRGIEFTNGDGIGVRLKYRSANEQKAATH